MKYAWWCIGFVTVALMLWTFTLRGDAAVFNVLNFGATPNDASGDRAAIQAALDAAGNGDLVLVPSGGAACTLHWLGRSCRSDGRN